MGETHEPQKRVFFVFFLNQKQWLEVIILMVIGSWFTVIDYRVLANGQ